jgi:hypothetical protein
MIIHWDDLEICFATMFWPLLIILSPIFGLIFGIKELTTLITKQIKK